MSSHAKTILLIIVFFILIVLSVFYYIATKQENRNRIETTEERLIRESEPGQPIIISPEDQQRLLEESRPN